MNDLLIVVAAAGASHIIVESPLFAWARQRLKLLNCYQCTGAYAGFACGLLGDGLSWHLPLYGFAGSMASTAAATVLDWFRTDLPGRNE